MHVEAERLVHFSPLLRCTGFQMENDFKALALGYFACAVPSSIDNWKVIREGVRKKS